MEDKRKKYSRAPLLLDSGSKLPPQAIEMEEAILGALMIDKDAFDNVMEIISPETFYKDSHGIIYQTICDLKIENSPVDILTVADHLKKNGKLELVGGSYYVTQLTNKVASAANIVTHSYIIKEKYILREIIRISGEMQAMAYDDDTDFEEAIEKFEEGMQPIRDFLGGVNPYIPWARLLDDENKKIKVIATQKNLDLLGANTGSEKLNRILGGFRNSDLIIVAARPGIGKTTRSLAYAKAAALTGKPVTVFSLEMKAEQLVRKYIVEESEVWSEKFLLGTLTDQDLLEIDKAVAELKKLPIEIIDKPGIKPMYVKATIRKIKKKKGPIGLVVIDYLQLMNANVTSKGNREQEVSNISKTLKELAKEEDVPVLALSQLGRGVETRANKRPILSDLRESGSIEQDADSVLMLYSPVKYYHEKTKDPDYKDREDITQEVYEQLMETWIMKNRHGAADIFVLETFNKHIGRFKFYSPDAIEHHDVTIPQDTSWERGHDLFNSLDSDEPVPFNPAPF